MIRIRDTRYPSSAALLRDAIDIAEFYGFVPLNDVPRGDAKKMAKAKTVEDAISFARKEERTLIPVVRRALPHSRATDSALFTWRVIETLGSVPTLTLELHVIGHQSAMAEALLIIIANSIATHIGLSQTVLSLNNIGSSESSGRFIRDVGLYLRKHIDTISPTLRPRAATDPVGTLVQLIERGHPAIARAPQAMEYLTEDERSRFWDFLEYLEVYGLPYELSSHVLGSRDCWAHALYQIATVDKESGLRIPIAFGGRYDPIASRVGKSPSAAAMIGITIESKGSTHIKKGSQLAPNIFFAHLGIEARRRAFSVLELLRHASVPVHQSLTFERLGDQMVSAKKLSVPYILIMGHKEATENAIMVREVATNFQETIPLNELVGYLKRRKLATIA